MQDFKPASLKAIILCCFSQILRLYKVGRIAVQSGCKLQYAVETGFVNIFAALFVLLDRAERDAAG